MRPQWLDHNFGDGDVAGQFLEPKSFSGLVLSKKENLWL